VKVVHRDSTYDRVWKIYFSYYYRGELWYRIVFIYLESREEIFEIHYNITLLSSNRKATAEGGTAEAEDEEGGVSYACIQLKL
jgi:hypothetical protein